jgi:hypothetical protein
MASSGILRRAALVRTDVSEEYSASIIRVTKIGKLGTMLAIATDALYEDYKASTLYFFVACVGC